MHIFFFFSKITISTYSNIIFFNFFFYSLNHSNIISYLFSGIHNYDKKKKKKNPLHYLHMGHRLGGEMIFVHALQYSTSTLHQNV
jgi:hypothetical protein